MEVDTKEQEVSEEEQGVVTSEAESEEESEVTEESEGKEGEQAPKLTEEVKQQIISDEYAKWQSKTLNPISKERDELRKQVSDLNTKLEDKSDTRELDLLLKADIEELGEEEAKKVDQIRRNYTAKLREFRDNNAKVSQTIKENETLSEKLGGIERRQMATEFYLDLRDKGMVTVKNKEEVLSRLETAKDPDHFKDLKEVIEAKFKVGKKPFVPDSSTNKGGGGVDYSKLPIEERINALLAEGERKKKSR